MCVMFFLNQLWLATPEGDTWPPSGIGLKEQVLHTTVGAEVCHCFVQC